MSRERFEELMRDAVTTLPQDVKSALRIVEDPEVDDESRVSVAGGLLHVISDGAAVPGVRGTLQHVGSVLILRLAFERAFKKSPDAMQRHAEESPGLLGNLTEELEVARSYLDTGMSVLEKQVDNLPKLNHQGHSAPQCVNDVESSTWLYDTVHISLVEKLEIDEETVAREVKGSDRLQKSLAARANK